MAKALDQGSSGKTSTRIRKCVYDAHMFSSRCLAGGAFPVRTFGVHISSFIRVRSSVPQLLCQSCN